MRGRKNVLLYCADAELGSTIACVLGVRCISPHVRVTKAFSAKDFLWESMADTADFDCVVVIRSLRCEDRRVLALLRGDTVGKLTVEVLNGQDALVSSCAQKRVHGPVKTSMNEIVEMVRLACARKRGPKGPKDDPEYDGYRLAMIGLPAGVA